MATVLILAGDTCEIDASASIMVHAPSMEMGGTASQIGASLKGLTDVQQNLRDLYVAKAAVDNLTHQAGNSIFEVWGPWFDARTSWKNKYAAGSWEAGAPRPRFWLSTTVFVFVTDFWHLADSVYLTAYLGGGALPGCWLATARPLA